MDRIIDQAWISLLANSVNKQEKLRPEIGDAIDVYLTQSRLLSLVSQNSFATGTLYHAAYDLARRNAAKIVKKLGTPTDHFWKFEYWPKSRAMSTLGQLVKRVFSSMFTQANEGNMTIVGLEVEPLRITVNFEDCAECAGIERTSQQLCYYHAGTLVGILSGLINQDLIAYETDCQATGKEFCSFVVGQEDDQQMKDANSNYLTSHEINTDLVTHLDKTLQNQSVRSLGNQVNVNYHRLAIANALTSDPKRLAADHFQAGNALGTKLTAKLEEFFGSKELKNVRKYYSQLGELRIEVNEDKLLLDLELNECAESIGPDKSMEMMSFLLGEIQGLVSEITQRELVVKDSRFEGEKLLLTLSPP